MKRLLVLFTAVFGFIPALLFGQTSVKRQSLPEAATEEILKVAQNFWVIANLGDLAAWAPSVRVQDIKLIPQPKGEGLKMMEFRTLPELQQIRRNIQEVCLKAFSFTDPELAPDNLSATINITVDPEHLVSFFQQKLIYDLYMAEAYISAKEGKEQRPLEAVKAAVLATDSVHKRQIEEKILGIQKAKIPELRLEKSDNAWRVNLEHFLGKR